MLKHEEVGQSSWTNQLEHHTHKWQAFERLTEQAGHADNKLEAYTGYRLWNVTYNNVWPCDGERCLTEHVEHTGYRLWNVTYNDVTLRWWTQSYRTSWTHWKKSWKPTDFDIRHRTMCNGIMVKAALRNKLNTLAKTLEAYRLWYLTQDNV